MRKTTYLQFIAVFLATLIVSLPYVHAQSMTITKNSGQDNAQDGTAGFIRNYNDVWSLVVNALIPGQTIAPSQVKVNSIPFDTCTSAVSGYNCAYTFDYTGQSLGPEMQYSVVIDLYNADESQLLVSRTTTVTADGSGPSFVDLNVRQAGSQVRVEMTLKEEPDACAGLGRIEIFDADSNIKLKTLTGTELQSQISDRCGENSISTNVVFPSAGNMTKTGRVVAYDRLNNSATATDAFTYDYRLPVILANTFRLDNFGDYIPSGSGVVDSYLDVAENGDYLTAQATSSTLGWVNEEAVCTKTDYVNNIFTCVWPATAVQFNSATDLTVTVDDGANIVTQPITKNFIIDATPPTIDFFGAGEFDGTSYITTNNNNIKVVFNEGQSGIDTASVKADLSGINIYKSIDTPADNCTQTSSSQWTCYWYDIDDAQAGKIYLVNAQDKVGNNVDTTASAASADLVMDTIKPDISDVLVVVPQANTEPVSFYRSGDVLRIDFIVTEEHGVTAQVDLSDVVNDFGSTPNNNGVVNASCISINNTYACTVATTPHIKSADPNAEIRFIASDAAGNQGEYIYNLSILGSTTEANPNYWSKGTVVMSPSAVDVATTQLVAQRVYVNVPLKTSSNVKLLGITLVGCLGDTDRLLQSFMVNNMFGSTSPYIVLELNAEDFSGTSELHFNCTFNIFSRRGNDIITNPEKENISITIPFYQTKFDSEHAALDEKIKDARKYAGNTWFQTLGILKKIIVAAKLSCATLQLIDKLWIIIQAVVAAWEVAGKAVYTKEMATNACKLLKKGFDPIKGTLWGTLGKFCKVISCQAGILSFLQTEVFDPPKEGEEPDPPKEGEEPKGPGTGLDAWWTSHVSQPAETNYRLGGTKSSDQIAKFKNETGTNADPYSNIVMAVANLCVPAIIYNLEKLRQIECRYVGCLENDVKEGVATVEACKDLKHYQTCKFWIGGVFYLIPFVGIIDAWIAKIKGLLTDPIGLIDFIFGYACAEFCDFSQLTVVLCHLRAALSGALDMANDIAGIVRQGKSLNADYCSEVGVS